MTLKTCAQLQLSITEITLKMHIINDPFLHTRKNRTTINYFDIRTITIQIITSILYLEPAVKKAVIITEKNPTLTTGHYKKNTFTRQITVGLSI